MREPEGANPTRSDDWSLAGVAGFALFIFVSGVASLLVTAWILLAGRSPTLSGEGELEALKVQARPIIEAVEQHRRAHGRYPETLGEAGLALTETRFGPWRYQANVEEDGFTLAVGDYDDNLFVLLYYGGTSDLWVVDR